MDIKLNYIEKGEGKTTFNFEVTDLEGKTTKFLVKTNKTIVGDALQEVGLIEGEEGAYGLYVKTVNGITADWDKDQTYWAFYIGDDYGMGGNDESVYQSDFPYITIDNYLDFPKVVAPLLK